MADCHCMNEGVCVVEATITRCECPLGFAGERCGQVEIFFEETRKKKNPTISITNLGYVFIGILLTLTIGIILFFIWRRIRSLRRKVKKMCDGEEYWLKSSKRRNSKVDEDLLVSLGSLNPSELTKLLMIQEMNNEANKLLTRGQPLLQASGSKADSEKKVSLEGKDVRLPAGDICISFDLNLSKSRAQPERKRKAGISR